MNKLAAEFLGTFALVSAGTGAIVINDTSGGVVALEALFAGPISGASMNPARSLAHALVSLKMDHLWIYLVAPALGAAGAVMACRCVRGAGCCAAGRAMAEVGAVG